MLRTLVANLQKKLARPYWRFLSYACLPLVIFGVFAMAAWRLQLKELQVAETGNTAAVIAFDQQVNSRAYRVEVIDLLRVREPIRIAETIPNWPPEDFVLSRDGKFFGYANAKSLVVIELLAKSCKRWIWPLPDRFAGRLRFDSKSEGQISFLTESDTVPPKPLLGTLSIRTGDITTRRVEEFAKRQRHSTSLYSTETGGRVAHQRGGAWVNARLQVVSESPDGQKAVLNSGPYGRWYVLVGVASVMTCVWWLLWMWSHAKQKRSVCPFIDAGFLYGIVIGACVVRVNAGQGLLLTIGDMEVWGLIAATLSMNVCLLGWMIFGDFRWPIQVFFGLLVLAGWVIVGSLLRDLRSTQIVAIRMLLLGTLSSSLLLFTCKKWFLREAHVGGDAIKKSNRKQSLLIRDVMLWTLAIALICVCYRDGALRWSTGGISLSREPIALALAICAVIVMVTSWRPVVGVLLITGVYVTSSLSGNASHVTLPIGMLSIACLLMFLSRVSFRCNGYMFIRKGQEMDQKTSLSDSQGAAQ